MSYVMTSDEARGEAARGAAPEENLTHADLLAALKSTRKDLADHDAHLEVLVGDGIMELCQNEYRLQEETAAIEAITHGLLTDQLWDQETERLVLDTCLRATESRAALFGELARDDSLAVSVTAGPLMDSSGVSAAHAEQKHGPFPVRGVLGWVLRRGEPLLCNDVAAHPDRIDLPIGRIPVTSFLAVPVKDGADTVGLVAVINKEGGYTPADQETLSRLVAVLMVARRYRSLLGEKRLAAK